MLENMLLLLHCMQLYPSYCLDFPLVGLVIELVWVDLWVAVTVVVGSTTVVDSAMEMAWIVDMQNVVVEMVSIVNIVDMQMAIGIVAGIVVDTVEVAGFHNHILSNFVQVVVNIVVEAKLAMALEGSKDYKVDRHNFVEGIVADLVEAS